MSSELVWGGNMRVIAGKHKGRALKAVPGQKTRPTTDKIKESVFQMIGPYFHGGRCLDLFAGSGSLGIEALSRGMDEAIFIDKQGKAIQTIKNNLKTLDLTEETEVYRNDAFRAIKVLAKRGLTFQLVFLDPPYKIGKYGALIDSIMSHQILGESGFIYCEHDASENILCKNSYLTLFKQQVYGGTTGITIFQKGEK